MRFTRLPLLLPLSLLALHPITAPVRAQEPDNEAIAAAKKAAMVIEMSGSAPVKPDGFYVKVEVTIDKIGRTAAQEEYQRSMDTLRNALEKAGISSGEPMVSNIWRRVGEASFTNVSGPESQDPPNSSFRWVGQFAFRPATGAKVKEAFQVMRATGVAANVIVEHFIKDDEAARRAALKVAIAQAKQRVQVLSEAAKPKEFELVFLKEGEFQISNASTFAALQGKEPIQTSDTISAEINIVLFYGLKPSGPAPAPKTVATKAPAKRTGKP